LGKIERDSHSTHVCGVFNFPGCEYKRTTMVEMSIVMMMDGDDDDG